MESIQIEAYNKILHGCNILCQGPFGNTFPPIMESIQKLKEPFKKKLLLTNTTFSFSKYITLQYDAIFQVHVNDWTLILTYITYAPKPLLIVAEDIVIPDALWHKINKTITFVNISSSYVLNVRPYDTIFFQPIEELSTYTDHVLKLLQMVYKPSYSQKDHKEIIHELRVAGAGICWTRHEEDTSSGSIYWYDPVMNQGDRLSNKQMSELFNWLSHQFY